MLCIRARLTLPKALSLDPTDLDRMEAIQTLAALNREQ